MSTLLRAAACAALALSLAGCNEASERAQQEPRPSIRLSPAETRSETGADWGALMDRDTGRGITLSGATRFVVRFDHPVEIRRVKLHAAPGVRLTAGGTQLEAGAGWSAVDLTEPATATELSLFASGTGSIDEIEVWGAGLERAPRSLSALAAASLAASAQFEDARILRSPSTRIALSPPGAATGESCASASFPGFDPRQARRAFLVYEANLPRHVSLQRSLNGEPPSGGFWVGGARGAASLVDEIDPETLAVQNTVLLCLPLDASAEATITGLRLVLLLDAGDAFVDRETAGRAAALFDGDLATTSPVAAGPLDVQFDRRVQVARAELRVPASTTIDALGTFDGNAWTQTAPLVVAPEAGRLPLEDATVQALRVTFPPGARPDRPAANVSELLLSGSGVGPRIGAARIVITYPTLRQDGSRQVGERFDSRAFLTGWAESPAGRGTVEVEGVPADVDGSFSVPLSRAAAATGTWPVVLKARFPDGEEVVRTIYFDDDRGANADGSATSPLVVSADELYGRENQESRSTVDREKGGRVSLGSEVSVEVPPGAVNQATSIGITRKGFESVPALDAGMVNVTAPAHGAYRFLPRGQRFSAPVKVTLPYEPALLPEGVTAEEIRTYYFDEAVQRWIALPRHELRGADRRLVSTTTHFTFMINAVLVLPDHPGPASFDPNSIKGIAAAEPSAGIDLIQAPDATAMGTAQLAYPLRLPPARGAHQPELRVVYDSGSGNGWLGVGWDLAVPSIQVDTRFGVPAPGAEPRYLLEGQQLVPTEGQARCEGTSASGRLYLERVARTFSRVVRCGEDPRSYWFEVSDRSGTLSVFGHGDEATLRSPRADQTIAQWFLERVVDLNGNLTEYHYDADAWSPRDFAFHREPFRQVYLRSIRYTGRASREGSGAVEGGTPGPYVVDLYSQTNPSGGLSARSDAFSSARFGFKVLTRRLLGTVRVSLASSPIREYGFTYETGAFGKARLKILSASAYVGGATQPFYSHDFHYEKLPESPFGEDPIAIAWHFPPDAPEATQLGQSEENARSRQGGLSLSIGPLSIGGKKGKSSSSTNTLAMFADVNGDGLPDRLVGGPSGGRVTFNAGGGVEGGTFTKSLPGGDPAVGVDPGLIAVGLGTENGRSKITNYSAGVAGIGASTGKSSFSSTQSSALQDVDGDGFLDWAGAGTVLRGQPRDAEHPGFAFVPWAGPGLQTDPTTRSVFAEIFGALVDDERRPSDAVIEWVAPFEGEVDVTGWLSLVDRPWPAGDPDWDGVRLRVYRADELDGEFPAEQLAEVSTDIAHAVTEVPVVLEAVSVSPGTRLYFVLSTLENFPVGLGTRSPLEEAQFAPTIQYRGIPAEDLQRVDPTGARTFVFDSTADFRLAGGGPQAVVVPASGRLRIETTVIKLPSTSHVRYCIQRFPEAALPLDSPCAGGPFTLVGAHSYDAGTELTEAFNVDTDITKGDRLVFRIESNLAMDPADVGWEIQGRMTEVLDDEGVLRPPDPSAAQQVSFIADPFVPLHESVDAAPPVDGRWSALPDPTPPMPLIVPGDGELVIVTHRAEDAAPGSPVWIAARTKDALIFERSLADAPLTLTVQALAGQEIFLEAHSEEATAFSWIPTITFTPSGGQARDLALGTEVPLIITRDAVLDSESQSLRIRSPFGGGYHGWRYGAWHGENGATFDPNAIIVLAPFIRGALWELLASRLDDPASLESLAIAATSPLFPRRLGTYSGGTTPGLRPGVPAFVSLKRDTFVTASSMHASREFVLEEESGLMRFLETFQRSGALRTTAGRSTLVGFNVMNIGVNKTTGNSRQVTDLVDMNGDRLVDRVAYRAVLTFWPPAVESSTEVSFTNASDLAAGTPIQAPGEILRSNFDVGGTANIGKSTPMTKVSSDSSTVQAVVGSASIGASVAMGVNLSSADRELMDINGDGLPDVVESPAPCPSGLCFPVRLNLGTGVFGEVDLLPVASWGNEVDGLRALLSDGGDAAMFGPNRIRRTTATTLKTSVGYAFIFGTSKGWESSVAQTAVMLVDVTGDGLPDYVRKGPKDKALRVMVNTGSGFLGEASWGLPEWPDTATQPFLDGQGFFGSAGSDLFEGATASVSRIDAVEATGSWSPVGSTGFSVEVGIPVGPFVIGGSYSEERSLRETGLQLGMLDIDGDGFADHVLKAEPREDGTSNADVNVRLNRLGRANLLSRVVRPLGGKIDIEYARAGNTVAMPENRWVMTRVTVHDGGGSDDPATPVRGHDLRTDFGYANGRHDRYEREFLGFGEVKRFNADGSKVVRQYLNDRLANKGLLASERVLSGDAVLVETVNEYRDPYSEPMFRVFGGTDDCESARPFNLPEDAWFCGSLFPALRVTRTRHYEGSPTARVETRRELTYDLEKGPTAPANGNIVAMDDFGDASPVNVTDDLHATVDYWADELATNLHSVSRPRRVVVTDSASKLLRKREGHYDGRGNLERLVSWSDANVSSETDLHWNDLGLLDRVEGPVVRAGRYRVDYGYDDVVRTFRRTTTDSHGYSSTVEWDYALGEVTETTDVNGQKTLRVYDGFGRLTDFHGPHDPANVLIHVDYSLKDPVAYARSRHRLPEGGWLDTVVHQDGLGRVLQTRKTSEVHGLGTGWSVSGHVRFDAMGRVERQGQSFFELGFGLAYSDATPLYPTLFAYDALGRTVRVEAPVEKTPAHPEGKAVTTTTFGFGTAGVGDPHLRRTATVVDPEQKTRVLYRDPADRVVAIEERDKGVAAFTRYEWDPVGQLIHIDDAADHRTTLGYDLLGRRTLIDNPDAGAVSFAFDGAGNVIEKLDAKGQKTRFVYEFDQLLTIDYPESSDVTFEYGPPGALENAAGRVTRLTDDAGSETRGYGPLGELTRATRTVRPFRTGDTDKVFETTFQYDAFGRMRWIRYPDGEKVSYGYDAGGQLESAAGVRPPNANGVAEKETYVSALTYDEFGQRKVMTLGNGAVTTYAYYPESRRLSAIHTTTAGRTIQALTYQYDRVGNVLGLDNTLPAATGSRSGPTKFSFGYDDLHRLTSATGTAESRPGVIDSFAASYVYDAIHNMKQNTQVHVVKTLGLPGEGVGYPPATNHDFAYAYSQQKPHQATQIGDTAITYDKNGNQEMECGGAAGCGESAAHLRRFYWNEENRLLAVVDGGGANVTRFVYDAKGDRVAKLGRGGESLTIGQFFSLKGRKSAAKHVFAGMTRIATRIGTPPGWQPATSEVVSAAPGEPPSGSDLPGCQSSDYQPLKCGSYPGGDPVVVGPPDQKVKPATYYYHSDQLGSTGWVTDQNGRVHEHVEYFPYGQLWRDVRADTDGHGALDQRFLFTGKELDEETGLYYFGARYYDPVRVRWASTDPIICLPIGSLDNSSGRVYSPQIGFADSEMGQSGSPGTLNRYSYVMNNPYKYTDPTGRWASDVHYGDTRLWALQAGFSEKQAVSIARADNGVDGGLTGPYMLGFQDYHFNASGPGAQDSRARLAEGWFRAAVRYGRIAAHYRKHALEDPEHTWGLEANKYEEYAMEALGTALHPLQDIDAHSSQRKALGVYSHGRGVDVKRARPEAHAASKVASEKMMDRYKKEVAK